MKNGRYLFTTIVKLMLGIILGLVFSFVTIVCLEILLPDPNPFRKEAVNLWLVGPIIAGWLLVMLWLMLRRPSSKNIQTQGIDNLPVSVSELIDGIIDAMRYRKSIRAEVRQELTDHFTDALRDCKNEQEKQEQIKQLIEEFGDRDLLGILIRRGKKRCQPVWRKILTHIPHAIGVLILLFVLYLGWFFTGKPQISTNYLLAFNQQVRPQADESQNAWPFYERAADNYIPPKLLDPDTGELIIKDQKVQFLPEQQETFIELDISPKNPEELTPSERKILDQWLADNRNSMELIRQGNQKPFCWRTYACGDEETTEMLGILMPSLNHFKRLAQLLCWQGLIEASRGDFKNAFDTIFQCYSLGQHIRGQNTTLIEQLVAMAVKSLSSQTVRSLLDDYDDRIDSETLSVGRQRFQKFLTGEDFTVDFESERLFMYDEIQRCFTESQFGYSHLYLPRLGELGVGPNDEMELFMEYGFSIFFTHPDKKETFKSVDTFYGYLQNMSQKTPATLQAEGIDLESHVENMTAENVFLKIFTPALSKVIELTYRNQIDSYATLTTIAIIEYRKIHGDYPVTLNKLVQEKMLQDVPLDPFSNKPLVYRPTEDGFILYSVGTNFSDDNGAPATDDDGKPRQWGKNGDWIFWPVPKD